MDQLDNTAATAVVDALVELWGAQTQSSMNAADKKLQEARDFRKRRLSHTQGSSQARAVKSVSAPMFSNTSPYDSYQLEKPHR